MFFRRAKGQPYLKAEYREWIEDLLGWFAQVIDDSYLYTRPMVEPQDLPEQVSVSLHSPQFEQIYTRVCRDLHVLPDRVGLSIIEEVPKDRLMRLFGVARAPSAAGLYLEQSDLPGKDCEVWLSTKVFEHPESLVSTLAHEMSHVKLLGERILRRNHPDMERITDLSLVFFGYGIPKLNSIEGRKLFSQVAQSGYVSQELIGHGLACMAYLRNEADPAWISQIRPRLQKYVRASLDYLFESGNHRLPKISI